MDAIIEVIEAATGMSASEALGKGVLYFAIASMFIEITPVKLNPVTLFVDWIKKKIRAFGNMLNGPVLEELVKQKEAVNEIRDVVDDNEIDRIRWEILDFANSCRQGKRHTHDEFIHIIELNSKYHKILERRKLENGIIDLEYNYITKLYARCEENDDFL